MWNIYNCMLQTVAYKLVTYRAKNISPKAFSFLKKNNCRIIGLPFIWYKFHDCCDFLIHDHQEAFNDMQHKMCFGRKWLLEMKDRNIP